MRANLASLKAQANIRHMTADSRQVHAGSLFVAYKGDATDGRAYIPQAIANGASAVMWEQEGFAWNANWQVPNYSVAGLKQEVGKVASEFYSKPSDQLWMVGVTGTNGKTTCSHWLAQAFTALGRQTAVVGTIGNGLLSNLSKTSNTTPDAIVLHGLLADYLAQKAQVVDQFEVTNGKPVEPNKPVLFDTGQIRNVFDMVVLGNIEVMQNGACCHNAVFHALNPKTFKRFYLEMAV